MTRILKRSGHSRAGAGILAAAMLLAVLPLGFFSVAHAENAVLKVGYTDSDGITVDEEGNHSGYVVDYLEEIAKYTGWEYEYVYDTWGNGLDELERGGLDLLVMTHYTEERGERFLFSELPIAQDYMVLYAALDSDIYYQDYGAFDGCKVGVVAETVFEDVFADYARKLDLRHEIVHFNTEAEAKEALLRGDVQLIATSGFANYSEVKLVDRFRLEMAYIAAGIGERALVDELNEATQKVRIQNGGLEYDLMQTYYTASSAITNLYLTREEQAYLDSVGAIVVKTFDGRRPMAYTTEDGNFVGILMDYLNMLGADCGLEFVYEPTEIMSLEGNASAMEEEGYGLIFLDQSLEALELEDALYKTEALFETALAYVRRQGEVVTKTDGHAFAINSEMSYLGAMLLATNKDYIVRYYDTSQECMEAVLDGEADMTILDEHVAAYLLQKPKFADHLVRIPGSGAYLDGMCLYAPEEHRYLVSILNKALEHLTREQRQNAVSNAMLSHSYEYQPDDMLYEYGTLMSIFAAFFIVILALGGMLYIRITRLRIQKKENEALQERIQLDELTGVYNRAFFFEKAREMIERGGDDLYIVRLNVSHFKVINELYGSAKGDRLLWEIGRVLKTLSLKKGFVVGRFTADHFYLCLRREDFERIGFARRSSAPWLGMDVTLSYGIYPVGAQKDIPVSAMCDRADMAIASNEPAASEYICYYSDESRRRLLYEQEIENEMEQALAERQFCIYVQPKYNIKTEKIVGGEALVRWNHPRKGMIPPGDFIGLFEKNGFILALDHYIWEESCRFLAEAKAKGLPACPLSVNVSRIHFYGMEFQDKLLELLERYGLEPWELELEITESICSEEPEVIFSKCEQLRALGFKIAMDDFGSGYSSLNMLRRIPLDIIKMDLKFLSGDTDAAQAEKGRNILRTLIELAHTLGLQVVVEGLETEAQKNFIRSIGDSVAQGYYYSRPVDCQSYEAMLSEAKKLYPQDIQRRLDGTFSAILR